MEFASGIAAGLAGGCLALIGSLSSRLTSVEIRVAQIDAKLDALLKHSDVNYDPLDGLSDKISQALKLGKRGKIEAIKIYRNVSGVGLKEAKEFIEEGMKEGRYEA
ncbi:MAG: ribosomal protein L7/L12 [Kiritimatiellia bacterium]|jgi:hypothetical protein|nr:ribosomal protein L7/L12 [Kiritimatiellia bacterium]MDP6848736.1 ribosomal protein L7/L12 [Kiritimatiellia bacterium]